MIPGTGLRGAGTPCIVRNRSAWASTTIGRAATGAPSGPAGRRPRPCRGRPPSSRPSRRGPAGTGARRRAQPVVVLILEVGEDDPGGDTKSRPGRDVESACRIYRPRDPGRRRCGACRRALRAVKGSWEKRFEREVRLLARARGRQEPAAARRDGRAGPVRIRPRVPSPAPRQTIRHGMALAGREPVDRPTTAGRTPRRSWRPCQPRRSGSA